MTVITNKRMNRSGLTLWSHDHAELLARLFYGIPLPACTKPEDNRVRGARLSALLRRGAITPDRAVTDFGVKLLHVYTEVREPKTVRCLHCLHGLIGKHFSAGRTVCKTCRAAQLRKSKEARA